MFKSVYGPCRQPNRACWFCNSDLHGSLDEVATTFNWPAVSYTRVGDKNNAWPQIKGLNVYPSEALPAVGTPGDLVLADMSQWGMFVNVDNQTGIASLEAGIGMAAMDMGVPAGFSGAIEATASLHRLFDQDLVPFKFRARMGGQSLWPNSVTTINNTLVGPAAIIAQR